MTNEELDNAREIEAIRIYDLEQNDSNGHGLARIAARLAREGWTPPVAVDPDLAEAERLRDYWADDIIDVALAGIKRGRALAAAEAKPGMVWIKHDRSEKSPIADRDTWVLTRNYDPETTYAMAYSCNRAHKRLWQYVTHYAVITPSAEDVA